MSGSQFFLQFLPMPLNQIHQERRYRRPAPEFQRTSKGHAIQQLVNVERQIDSAGDVRALWLFRFGVQCPLWHVSIEFSAFPIGNSVVRVFQCVVKRSLRMVIANCCSDLR